MTTVTGTLKTILKNPSSVTGVMIRASRLRTNVDGVTTGEMEAVDWDPTTGMVSFDAEPGQAYLILQMQGRPESISISIPDAPTATLREVIETNYVFDPPVVGAVQAARNETIQASASAKNFRDETFVYSRDAAECAEIATMKAGEAESAAWRAEMAVGQVKATENPPGSGLWTFNSAVLAIDETSPDSGLFTIGVINE